MSARPWIRALLAVAAVIAAPAGARAQAAEEARGIEAEAGADTEADSDTEADTEADSDSDTEADSAERPAPRPVPDYDGRPPPPPSPRDRAAYVPRVLLSPLYFVSEYVVRRPFGFLVRQLDPERVLRFFRIGPRERITLAPYFSWDFGFRPNVGVFFRAREVGAPGHSISAQGAFGGKRWYAGRLGEAYVTRDGRRMYRLDAEAVSRPDGLFFGIGGDVSDDDRARYHWVGVETVGTITLRHAFQSATSIRAGYRFRTFDDDVGDRESIEDLIAQGAPYGLPPGYVDGYSIAFLEVRSELDTRRDRPAPGSGYRLVGWLRSSMDVRDGPSSLAFFVYGGSIAGFLDVSGASHVLSLSATVVFSDAVRGEIPFTELPSLAGDGPLDGFVRPFLYADSGAALAATYTWPIWVFLDGKLDFAVGNGFDGHLRNFELGRLRFSSTIGIAAVIERVPLFEVAFGIGTDEITDGPNVEHFRFVLGTTQRF